MPTTIVKGPYRYYYNSGALIASGLSDVSVKRFDKTATVRRKKPVDLFAGATPRKVVSSTSKYTYGTEVDFYYNRITEAPMSYWAGVSPTPSLLEPSVSSFASLDNKVRSKIKDQNVNLANSLAEYRQTCGLLVSTARDVIRTFHSLRSGRPIRDFISILAHPETRNARRLSNRWLEYQYGWKPLLSDVFGSAEALAKILYEGVPLYQTVSDRQISKSTSSDILGFSLTEVDLRMKVRARYKISASGLKTISELGFTNPLSVAWELVPWSFVIDWIIPVGDYLNGLDALVGVSDLKVIRSYRYQIDYFRVLNYADRRTAFVVQPTGTYKEIVTNRLSVGSSLSFGSLRYEPSLTATRVANAMALLRQLKR